MLTARWVLRRAFGTVIAVLMLALGAVTARAQVVEQDTCRLIPGDVAGEWILEWASVPGEQYAILRGLDLGQWSTVATLTAEESVTGVPVTQMIGTQRTFWRIEQLGPAGDPVYVSDVLVSYTMSGAQSDALLEVTTAGYDTVQEVLFYDSGLLLGNAERGLGNAWSFSLQLDADAPTVRHLRADASTAGGDTAAAPVRSLLLADPAQFIPMDAGGRPKYGEFVAVDESGWLAPFFFSPERGAGREGSVGVLLEFPAGAALAGTGTGTRILFTEARLFRGEGDAEPLQHAGVEHSIPVDLLTPADVAAAFVIPAGEPLLLRWGDAWVEWADGALSESGWAGLGIIPRMGLYALPDRQGGVAITADPMTGTTFLTLQFDGAWAPVPGALEFAIPSADPLTVHIGRDGSISANGSAEATFPNGARVKGSLAWREPYFEFRFEGRGLVIPALASLRSVLPEDPLAGIPAGDTAEELDAYAATLLGYRNTLRGLAGAGQAQADTAGTDTFSPSSAPFDSAGSAMEAWAGRAATWSVDRAGQLLSDQQLQELAGVLVQAGRTGEAAHDLPTVLKLLRDYLILRDNSPAMAGTGAAADALAAALADAGPRLFAAAGRITRESPPLAADPAFVLAAGLLREIAMLAAPAPEAAAGVSGIALPAEGDDVDALLAGVSAGIDPAIFSARAVVHGDFDGYDNAVLAGMGREQLLAFLGEVAAVYDLLHTSGDAPTAATAPEIYPVLEAVRQTEVHLLDRHDARTAAALAKSDNDALRSILLERLRILRLYQAIGEQPLAGMDPFTTPTLDVIMAYEPVLAAWLTTLDPARRLDRYAEAAETLYEIAALAGDPALDSYLQQVWAELSSFNDRFLRLGGIADACDALEAELIDRGYRFTRYPEGYETAHAFGLTGRYESDPDNGLTLATLRINQAGRYLIGWIEYHAAGRPLTRYRLRGVLCSEMPGSMTFAFLRLEPGTGRIVTSGTLIGYDATSGVTALLEESSGRRRTFFRVSDTGTYSDNIVSLLSGEQEEMLTALQRGPLHSANVDYVLEKARSCMSLIAAYYATSDSAARMRAAVDINVRVGEILQRVSTDQIPLARLLLLRELSIRLLTVGGDARTYRDRLLVIYNVQTGLMPNVSLLLGEVPYMSDASPAFHYEFRVRLTGLAGFVLGGYGVSVEVEKTDLSSGNVVEYRYSGWLGQAGKGEGGFFGESESVYAFDSTLNYLEEDLEGWISAGSVGAGVTYGHLSVSLSAGFFKIAGNGAKPAVILDTGEGSSGGLQASAGLDFGVGRLLAESNVNDDDDLSITSTLINYTADYDAEVETVVHFEVDGSTVSECGWAYLREFIAEYRTLFDSGDATILVTGYTDTTGTSQYNFDLSNARAESVADAIVAIMGDASGVGARIATFGYGEDAALAAGVPDETDNPQWRRAEVTINQLVRMKVSAPSTVPTP